MPESHIVYWDMASKWYLGLATVYSYRGSASQIPLANVGILHKNCIHIFSWFWLPSALSGVGLRLQVGSQTYGTASLHELHDSWQENALTSLKENTFVRWICHCISVTHSSPNLHSPCCCYESPDKSHSRGMRQIHPVGVPDRSWEDTRIVGLESCNVLLHLSLESSGKGLMTHISRKLYPIADVLWWKQQRQRGRLKERSGREVMTLRRALNNVLLAFSCPSDLRACQASCW